MESIEVFVGYVFWSWGRKKFVVRVSMQVQLGIFIGVPLLVVFVIIFYHFSSKNMVWVIGYIEHA